MGLIDSHAHLTYPVLADQIDAVLARCESAGVQEVITIGTDLEDAGRAVTLADRYPGRIHAAAGFHPHKAEEVQSEELTAMAALWRHPRIVAIGEVGLDYHYDFADRSVQQATLARQLSLAQQINLPLIIHCREAFDDTVRILEDHGYSNRRVVFHCFTGSARDADRVAERSWRISFTGITTFKNSGALQAIARKYPANQLMIETDSPYLSPIPVRGKTPNEPAHLAHIARFLAELRGQDLGEFARQTECNTRAFFQLTRQGE